MAFALGGPAVAHAAGEADKRVQHATAAQQEAIARRTQIGYLRAFPALPGTAPCTVHPGGLQKPGTVFHGLCTTQVSGRGAGEGTTRITLTERFAVVGSSVTQGASS